MVKPLVKITTIIGAALIAGSLFGSIDFRTVLATKTYAVTTGPGISLSGAISAFTDESVKDELGLKNIIVFSKSGGSSDGGQMQPNLRMDIPVRLTENGHEVSVQYFVDVRNDMTGTKAFHCSDIRLHVFLDAKKVYTTGWMGYDDRDVRLPLRTDRITIHDVPIGWHDVGLIPEGRPGGCNSGFVQSWGGTGVLFEDR